MVTQVGPTREVSTDSSCTSQCGPLTVENSRYFNRRYGEQAMREKKHYQVQILMAALEEIEND